MIMNDNKRKYLIEKIIEKSDEEFWIDREGIIHKLDVDMFILDNPDTLILYSYHYEIVRQKFPQFKTEDEPNRLGGFITV